MFIGASWHPAGAEAARASLGQIAGDIAGDAFIAGSNVALAGSRARFGVQLGDLSFPPPELDDRSCRSLRGAYAVAGSSGASLVIARGALGGRPLYFAGDARTGFLASSRLEPLARALGPSLRIDAGRLGTLAAGVADPDPRATPFVQVRRVDACEAAVLGADGVHFAPRAVPELQAHRGSIADVAEGLWSALTASVSRAVEGKKNVAVMTGGGVDSSALLAVTVALSRGATPREVSAIALHFQAIGDDRPYLRDLCNSLGIVPLRIRPAEGGRYWRSSFVLDASPYTLTIAPMERRVFEAARESGAEALLTGYGADEILAGDMRTLASEPGPLSLLRAAHHAVHLDLPWPTTRAERLISFVIYPAVKRHLPDVMLRWRAARGEPTAEPWAGPTIERSLRAIRMAFSGTMPPRTPAQRYRRFAASSMYCDYVDLRGQLETATGLQRLDPFMDDDLLAWVSRARPFDMIDGGIHRGLFRRAAKGRVPDAVRMRRDKSFFEPAFAEMCEAGGGFDAVRDLCDVRALASLGIVDPAEFRGIVARIEAAPADSDAVGPLWTAATQVLACEAFAREYGRVV